LPEPEEITGRSFRMTVKSTKK